MAIHQDRRCHGLGGGEAEDRAVLGGDRPLELGDGVLDPALVGEVGALELPPEAQGLRELLLLDQGARLELRVGEARLLSGSSCSARSRTPRSALTVFRK